MSEYDDTERIDYNSKNELDDIAIGSVDLFRMERMSDGGFWIRLYRSNGKKDIVFWLNATKNENPSFRDNSPCKIDGTHEYD